ncbi:hypothetical protein HY041_04300 [Candidatus Roizmanbacteria bacterium]|nr:hypothetical protein [Candidatus Roizmanbacteria bacterium]
MRSAHLDNQEKQSIILQNPQHHQVALKGMHLLIKWLTRLDVNVHQYLSSANTQDRLLLFMQNLFSKLILEKLNIAQSRILNNNLHCSINYCPEKSLIKDMAKVRFFKLHATQFEENNVSVEFFYSLDFNKNCYVYSHSSSERGRESKNQKRFHLNNDCIQIPEYVRNQQNKEASLNRKKIQMHSKLHVMSINKAITEGCNPCHSCFKHNVVNPSRYEHDDYLKHVHGYHAINNMECNIPKNQEEEYNDKNRYFLYCFLILSKKDDWNWNNHQTIFLFIMENIIGFFLDNFLQDDEKPTLQYLVDIVLQEWMDVVFRICLDDRNIILTLLERLLRSTIVSYTGVRISDTEQKKFRNWEGAKMSITAALGVSFQEGVPSIELLLSELSVQPDTNISENSKYNYWSGTQGSLVSTTIPGYVYISSEYDQYFIFLITYYFFKYDPTHLSNFFEILSSDTDSFRDTPFCIYFQPKLSNIDQYINQLSSSKNIRDLKPLPCIYSKEEGHERFVSTSIFPTPVLLRANSTNDDNNDPKPIGTLTYRTYCKCQ